MNNDKVENLFFKIAESKEYEDVEYIFFTIRRTALEYIYRNRAYELPSFMQPLHDFIRIQLEKQEVDIDDLLMYILEKDNHSWGFSFILNCFKRKSCVEEIDYYNAVALQEKLSPYIYCDYHKFATLTLGFVVDYFAKSLIDISDIVKNEKFAYETNQYGLSKVNGAIFKRDGLVYDHKYYLYNILANTNVIGFTDNMPAFARIITEQITSGDILYRLDEQLAVPEEQIISYSTLNFQKFYGPQFNFRDTVLKSKETIIVHIDEDTMDKLLMVIKQCKDDLSGENFWHIEIETLPYIDEKKVHSGHIITTFLHGMYYPDRDIFTHIDYTRNQYEIKNYLLKYSESTDDVPIDFHTEKKLHYKIWCVENGEYSRKTWYDFMITSLSNRYQKLLNEILE